MSTRIQGGHETPLLRSMQQTRTRLDRTQQRLSSGLRIATAADDAAGLAIARRLAAAVRGAAQGEQNLGSGVSLARTAEGALQGTHDGLVRMRELSVHAQNGTLSADDRAALQQEYDQIAASFDQTAGGTSFGGRALLDGSASGSNAVVVTDGQAESTRLDLPDMRAAALGVAGRSVGDPTTIAALDEAVQQISDTRTSLGATENRLGRSAQQLASGRVAAEAARSRIEDADCASEVAEQTRDRILLGLQMSVHRIAGGSSLHLLDLLG